MSGSPTARIESALRDFALLESSTPVQLAQLAELGRLWRFEPSQVIARQGDYGSSMFFVLAGGVVARLKRDEGAPIVLAMLGPGESFGELNLAGDRPRAATYVANLASEVFEVDKKEFTRALGGNLAVVKALDRAYRKAAIELNLVADALFADLPAESIAELTLQARMHAYEKDHVILEQGDVDDALYAVWSGHVRLAKRLAGGGERVFAYVREGDFFGEAALFDQRPRTTSVIANDHVELISVDRAAFQRVMLRHPAVLARVGERAERRAAEQRQLEASKSRVLFVDELIRHGAAFATEALVINLDLCTRCGACSNACYETYGASRITRIGKTFVLPDTRVPILMPSSCWHCQDPECMACPHDALRREASGEIHVIEDRCTGCQICADLCPWENISMAPRRRAGDTPLWRRIGDWLLGRPKVAVPRGSGSPTTAGRDGERPPEVPPELVAVKCDLCRTKESQACVNACPYGAIAVRDPNAYLTSALGSS